MSSYFRPGYATIRIYMYCIAMAAPLPGRRCMSNHTHVIVGCYVAPLGLRSIVMSTSVCLSVRTHNSKTVRTNFTKFLCILPVAMAQSSSDGVGIRYVLPVVRLTSCFHTMGPTGGRTGTELCSSPAPADVAAGRARAAAAHWLAGSAGRLAGARRPVRALAVRQLDSAAARTTFYSC